MKKFAPALLALIITGCVTEPSDPGLLNDPKVAEEAKRCQKLKAEIENLEGKPLQRGAAMENYEVECITDL